MKRFAVLAGLEAKKAVRLIPRLSAGALFMLIIVLAVGYTANGLLNEKPDVSDKPVASVGVVCYDESNMMELAKNMITSIKSISETVNIEFVSEEAAMDGLESGKYIVVAVIPENVIADIMSGKNTPVEVRFQPNAGYEAAAVKEVTDAAVNMLAASQAGIYSVYDFYGEHLRRSYISDALDRLNSRYIKTVLLREELFENTEVVATGELGVMEYYMISGIVLFLFLFGMNSLTFMEDYRREVTAALEQNGVGIMKQVIARFTGILCVYGIFAAMSTAVLAYASGTDIWTTVKLMAAILPIIAAVAAIVLAVQIYVANRTAAVMLMFLLAVLQSFVTGGFIPQLMLPREVSAAGRFTPAHYMIEQLRIVCMEERGVWVNTLILIIITLAVLCLACAGMKLRRKGRG